MHPLSSPDEASSGNVQAAHELQITHGRGSAWDLANFHPLPETEVDGALNSFHLLSPWSACSTVIRFLRDPKTIYFISIVPRSSSDLSCLRFNRSGSSDSSPFFLHLRRAFGLHESAPPRRASSACSACAAYRGARRGARGAAGLASVAQAQLVGGKPQKGELNGIQLTGERRQGKYRDWFPSGTFCHFCLRLIYLYRVKIVERIPSAL